MGLFDKGLNRKQERRAGAVLREIEAYWEALREDRDMPARNEVDPRGFQRALKHAFILERMAPGMARIRVGGSLLNDVMGMDVRGMPVSSLIGNDARNSFRLALEDVFRGPARARIRLNAERGMGRPALSGEMLLLPLRSTRGDVTRVLGGLEVDGQIGSRPRRFNLQSSFLRELRNDLDGVQGREDPNPEPALPPSVPQSFPRTVATRAPHLRLVVTTG